jgi:hypothetical protein
LSAKLARQVLIRDVKKKVEKSRYRQSTIKSILSGRRYLHLSVLEFTDRHVNSSHSSVFTCEVGLTSVENQVPQPRHVKLLPRSPSQDAKLQLQCQGFGNHRGGSSSHSKTEEEAITVGLEQAVSVTSVTLSKLSTANAVRTPT